MRLINLITQPGATTAVSSLYAYSSLGPAKDDSHYEIRNMHSYTLTEGCQEGLGAFRFYFVHLLVHHSRKNMPFHSCFQHIAVNLNLQSRLVLGRSKRSTVQIRPPTASQLLGVSWLAECGNISAVPLETQNAISDSQLPTTFQDFWRRNTRSNESFTVCVCTSILVENIPT